MPIGKHGTYHVEDDFVIVKCHGCGTDSNPFMHKDHLSADELVDYIQQITGFVVNKVEGAEDRQSFVALVGEKTGGLFCPICNEKRNKEVA